SHRFWQRRFNAGPGVVGSQVRVNGYPFSIVGVARSGFTGVEVGVEPDFFIPIAMRTEVTKNANWNNRNNWWLNVLGRLKPGAGAAQLETELLVINKNQEAENRRTAANPRFVNSAHPIKLLPGAQGYSRLRTRLEQPLIVLMSVVGVVLLIACANVANLLLARAAARRQEIALRLAVGSGRGRLIWQLLTESTLLGVLGGLAGLGLSYFGVQVLMSLMPQSGWTVVSLDVSPDLRLLGFTMAVSIVTGMIFGLAPALQATRPALVPALRQESGSTGSRAGYRLRKGLVVVQVALSLLLLIGAAMFVRSLRNLRGLDAGFRRDQILFVNIEPSRNGYRGQRLRDFYERLLERVSVIPGVHTATLATITPLGGSRWNQDVSVPGYARKAGDWNVVDQNAVSPRFFEQMGIPMVLGRDFRAEDNPAFTPTPPEIRKPGEPPTAEEKAGPRVAIVNESMVKKYYPGQNPSGMRFSYGDQYKTEESFEIVGVVKDAHYFGLREKKAPMIYQPVWRPGAGGRTLCIRTSSDSNRMLEAVRRVVHNLDASMPVLNSRTVEQ
ncbi:MAG: ABC transporter permease, partial [Bryobacteraceae bacterium]